MPASERVVFAYEAREVPSGAFVRPHVFGATSPAGIAINLIAERRMSPVVTADWDERRTFGEILGIDVSTDKLVVAVADGALGGEVVSWGTFENTPESVHALLRKLTKRAAPVAVCYEAGPTG